MTRRLRVTPSEYHADPCERPSLSSSIAHTLVTRSPLHAWTEHPRFGNIRKAATKEQSDGSIIHNLLLGTGPEIVVVDAPDFRTKAAREKRDEALAANALPIIADKYVMLKTVALELTKKLQDFGYALDGESEVAIEWESNGVLCRAMIDHIFWDAFIALDLKTITSADSATCTRHAYNFGYDIQHAAYSEAIITLNEAWAGRLDFLFAFMELDPPYAVVLRKPDGLLVELGKRRWQRAKEIWKRCLERDEWPSYADDVDILYAPSWVEPGDYDE